MTGADILRYLASYRTHPAGTIKDAVTRYAHQSGHYVSRRAGWDCHGLPVEYEIDQNLKITHRDQVMPERTLLYASTYASRGWSFFRFL